jgi:hypothetical protein
LSASGCGLRTNGAYSNATPILFPLRGTSIAAPSMEMFRTRQLVLDPPTEINATSSISARGCLRLSSIYLLVHRWSQSKVKPSLLARTMKTRPMGATSGGLSGSGCGDQRAPHGPRPLEKWGLASARQKTAREGMNLRGGCKGTNREIFRHSPKSAAPEYQHPIWSKVGTGLAATKNPARWGSKGGANQVVGAFASRLGGKLS